MAREISQAFDHPLMRSQAMPIEGVADRLSLRDHVVTVEIGAFQAERDMTQRLSFDIVVEVRAPEADAEDDVDQILSYDRLAWAIDHELKAERLNLLETLAERIADRILAEPQALRVFLRIQKLDKGNGKLGVEIVRELGQGAVELEAEVSPKVVFVERAVQKADGFAEWLRDEMAQQTQLVLCLDVPEARLRAADAQAQWTIDLLAIEQAAWQLAAEVDGLTVAASRTELDWALKNGMPCVWAPSKLVLDATESPEASAQGIAVWFSTQWNASALVKLGKDLPAEHTI